MRQIGVRVQTYYRWRKQYGGMNRDQLKRLKELEAENTRLRRAASDLTLDRMILAGEARGRHLKPFPPQAVHRPCAANPQRIGGPGLPHIGSASLDESRKVPCPRLDEARLTEDITALAETFGRYVLPGRVLWSKIPRGDIA